MRLNFERLEKVRMRTGKVIARCPACAELGADRSGEHLFIADDGRGPFGCVAHLGPLGEAHRKRIWELAGKSEPRGRFQFDSLSRARAFKKSAPRLPALRHLSVTEMAEIAQLRGWTYFVGLEFLRRRGLLWYAEVYDGGREWPSWLITDSDRRNAQARRLDGKTWQGIGGKKSKSLPGAESSWPIGASEIGHRPFVLLCEGQPDFCAALLLAWYEGLDVERVAPVCVTGAGNPLHSDALHHFSGKRVRIVLHSDEVGEKAGKRWVRQLRGAGATSVDCLQFDGLTMTNGLPVEDLADFATLLDPGNPPSARVLADVGHTLAG